MDKITKKKGEGSVNLLQKIHVIGKFIRKSKHREFIINNASHR